MALRRLTEEELAQRAEELANLLKRYDSVEEEKKEKAKEFGDLLKELRGQMTRIAAEIRDKHVNADQEVLPFVQVAFDDEPLGAAARRTKRG